MDKEHHRSLWVEGVASRSSTGEMELPRISRYLIVAATAACLLFGALSTLRFVGWSNLSPGKQESAIAPIAFDDYALQFYYGQLGSRFLSEGGVTYGYDPYFMAGYVKMPLYYPSSKPFELSLRLFSRFDPARVFNLTVFCMLAALPLLMYGAAANFRLSQAKRLVVVAASTVPNLMVPMAGWYGIMEAAGMVPYIFATVFSVFVVSLLSRFLSSGGLLTGLALGAAAPLLLWTHPTASLLAVLPALALYLSNFGRTTWRRHLWLWVILVVVVAANWPWLKGYILFRHYADMGDFYTPGGESHFTPAGGLLAPIRIYVPTPKLISLMPPLFGLVGLYAWWRERRVQELLIFLPQIVFLFLVTYYGAYLGLSAISPGRFTLPLGLYLFFPMAHGVVLMATWLGGRMRRIEPPYRTIAIGVVCPVVVVLFVLYSGLTEKIWRPYSIPELQASNGYTLHGKAFMAWIRENTDANGRILHEETDRLSHQYYGSHVAALIPFFTGRVLAGGPAPHPLLKHNYLRFIAGSLRGKRLERINERELASYFSLYNVRWVLCWSDRSKKYFDQLPLATPVGTYTKFALYRMDLPPSYFLRGAGNIELRENRIVLDDLVAEGGVVTLKYHWLESLRSDPPRRIEPVFMLDDPVPFISIVDPPQELTIYNDYDYD